MTIDKITHFPSRRSTFLSLLVVTLVALAVTIAPVWIIQPFKPQSVRGLELAYAMRRWSPWVTLIAMALGLFLVVQLWRGVRIGWKKVVLVIVLIPLIAATWFARQNHFEWMFNPLTNATYAKANEAGFVDEGDIVMAVERNGEAAAYPVRLMAYHHLVQDVVGGTPLVATY